MEKLFLLKPESEKGLGCVYRTRRWARELPQTLAQINRPQYGEASLLTPTRNPISSQRRDEGTPSVNSILLRSADVDVGCRAVPVVLSLL